VEIKFHVFLTSALGRGEWSASPSGLFTPAERLQYTLDRRLRGPQSRSERGGEDRKVLSLPLSGIEPRSSGS
jgi:hypothetical protein